MRKTMVQVFGAMPGHLAPFLLRSNNFTSVERTPWGGLHIADRYKRKVIDQSTATLRIGESWEFSVGDELASVDTDGKLLRDRIADDRLGMLGMEAEHGANTTSLLVKLLDADDDLSVQIHPFDDDPTLRANETGKTEAWLVLRADPNACIYLGLNSDVTEATLRTTLSQGGDVSQHLRRWEVVAGDFLVVEPGTPHAIGRGITLVEPQTATAGKRPLTYRYWDWNRRYDARGKLDSDGTARELHVERALAVTRWPALTHGEPPFARTGRVDLNATATWQALCAPKDAACIASRLRVGQFSGHGRVEVPDWNVLRALTIVAGEINVRDARHSLVAETGQTVVLPASATSLHLDLNHAHAVLSAAAV